MSDNIRVSGRLDITPPLPWRDYRKILPEHDGAMSTVPGASVLVFAESIDEVDTDDGPLRKRTAFGVAARTGDTWGKLHVLESELDTIAEHVYAAGSELTGYLYVDYEGGCPGVRRYSVVRRDRGPARHRVVQEDALLVWPDGRNAYVSVTETPDPPYHGGRPHTYLVFGTGERVFTPQPFPNGEPQ